MREPLHVVCGWGDTLAPLRGCVPAGARAVDLGGLTSPGSQLGEQGPDCYSWVSVSSRPNRRACAGKDTTEWAVH